MPIHGSVPKGGADGVQFSAGGVGGGLAFCVQGGKRLAIGARAKQLPAMKPSPAESAAISEASGRFAPDGAYALARLALSLLLATLIGAGMWAVIVVMPPAELDFGVERSAASLPYTVMMCTLAVSTIVLGRMTDRRGIVCP